MNKEKKTIENSIDDYNNTIHAIVGFINFYRYDTEKKEYKEDIKVFQGRKLNISDTPDKFLTPDIGILLPTNCGVIGEVKNNFPKDKSYWLKNFTQLMSYDNDLIGWTSVDEKIRTHDIVLLLHHSRSREVLNYFLNNKGKEINFIKPFIIIEYTRSDQRQAYIFFRKEYGNLSDNNINELLEKGEQVPMWVFLKEYSTIKIYDSEPELAFMLHLIWTYVVSMKASDNPRFKTLAKNQKIEVKIKIDEVMTELYEGYSFYRFHRENLERQPKIPKLEWIKRACEKFISLNEAKWDDNSKQSVTFYFKKYDDTLSYFIEKCSDDVQNKEQLELFSDIEDK